MAHDTKKINSQKGGNSSAEECSKSKKSIIKTGQTTTNQQKCLNMIRNLYAL